MKEIFLAGGCFWGTEHFMSLVDGVVETEVGYANGICENPSYEEVCTGHTNAAETVRVVYDPSRISLPFLLSLYFRTIDPTSLNRQGGDRGTQYRTGIYYTDPSDAELCRRAIDELQTHYTSPLQVELGPLQNFYRAEEYHQDYLNKNPRGYCHIDRSLMTLARNAHDPSLR